MMGYILYNITERNLCYCRRNIMRHKLRKQSALKLASRSETPIPEAKRIGIGWSNYPNSLWLLGTIPETKSSGIPQAQRSGAVSLNIFPKDRPMKRRGICPGSVIRIVRESFFSFLLQYSNHQLLRKCSISLKIEV
jgi:hypothetical protein